MVGAADSLGGDLFTALNTLLIRHGAVKIRALVCKLLGHLFRHSDQCYARVRHCSDSPSILESLVHQLEVSGARGRCPSYAGVVDMVALGRVEWATVREPPGT